MNANATCGTCKYRGEAINGYDTRLNYGDTGYFLCERILHLNGGKGFKKGQVAGVEDASGYHAALCVSTDFGCNQWAGRRGKIKAPETV